MWTILLLACGLETSVNYDKYNGGSLDGSIEGWVCDPEAGVWMENATVYTNIINAVGDFLDTRETVTDKDGHYLLEELLTDTTYTIYVQKGATTVDLFDVELGNDSQVLEKPQCSATATESTIAVVTGVYDDLPTVLTDLSLSVYEVNGKSGEDAAAFLTDSVNLEPFSMVMLAGGTVEEDVYYDSDGNDGAGTSAAVQAAIKAYVEGGGTLWATDWTYDIVEQIWPGKVDFLGEDKTPNAARWGRRGRWMRILRMEIGRMPSGRPVLKCSTKTIPGQWWNRWTKV